eukprot:5739480-Pleurochrysis_carterae.AAC.1
MKTAEEWRVLFETYILSLGKYASEQAKKPRKRRQAALLDCQMPLCTGAVAPVARAVFALNAH